jgi:hypothetical protein
VVLGEPDDEDGRLVDEVGVEVVLSPACGWGMKGESARCNLVMRLSESPSRPVISAAMAR